MRSQDYDEVQQAYRVIVRHIVIGILSAFVALVVFSPHLPAWANNAGSISGVVLGVSGGVVPGASAILRNCDTGIEWKSTTTDEGLYIFTAIPVGHYEIELRHSGFNPYKRTGLVIDLDTALKVDIPLEVGEPVGYVTVLDTAVHIDIESAEMGEVVSGKVLTGVALNGRSFTDLLALQPGIVPLSTQQPDSIVMAGASVAIAPSGGLNLGNQSITGQREDANGFLIDGGDVKEEMNGGTSIVPNLDSIAEFRILTSHLARCAAISLIAGHPFCVTDALNMFGSRVAFSTLVARGVV